MSAIRLPLFARMLLTSTRAASVAWVTRALPFKPSLAISYMADVMGFTRGVFSGFACPALAAALR